MSISLQLLITLGILAGIALGILKEGIGKREDKE